MGKRTDDVQITISIYSIPGSFKVQFMHTPIKRTGLMKWRSVVDDDDEQLGHTVQIFICPREEAAAAAI